MTPSSIHVPYIEGLEKMDFRDFDLAMDAYASKGTVMQVNWPGTYPYCPDCTFAIARSKTHLAVIYHVRGLDLRATQMTDNGRNWEDSCCEIFIQHPTDGSYYNFELNCIGSLLCSKQPRPHQGTRLAQKQLDRVIRFSTLPRKEVELEGRIFGWSAAMLIPFDLIGVDPEHLPATLKANLYKCGDLTAHPHFLSWSPIEHEKPNFHMPEFFGTLILS